MGWAGGIFSAQYSSAKITATRTAIIVTTFKVASRGKEVCGLDGNDESLSLVFQIEIRFSPVAWFCIRSEGAPEFGLVAIHS